MNIVLTGMMGTGKNLVGRELAQRTGMQYVNTDDIVEKKAGCAISDIFKDQGEDVFRDLERDAVRYAASLDNYVISTGGGVVKDKGIMDLLQENAVIVCLKADAKTIFQRTEKDDARPLLDVEDRLAEIQKLLDTREVFYSRCDFSVDTAGMEPGGIAGLILDFISGLRE